jgi:hypothetical protein
VNPFHASNDNGSTPPADTPPANTPLPNAPLAEYECLIAHYTAQSETLKRRIRAVSWARLAAVVLGCVGVYLLSLHSSNSPSHLKTDPLSTSIGAAFTAFMADQAIAVAVLAFAVIGFVVLVTLHSRWIQRQERLETLLWVNKRERGVLTGDADIMATIAHGGEALQDERVARGYALDLDILGRDSLAQRINRTATPVGYERLLHWLTEPLVNAEDIRKRQTLVRWLQPQLAFRQDWQATADASAAHTAQGVHRAREQQREQQASLQHSLQQWLQHSLRREGSITGAVAWVVRVLPVLTLAACAVAVFTGVIGVAGGIIEIIETTANRTALALVLLNLGVAALLLRRTSNEAGLVLHYTQVLRVYVRVFRLIASRRNEAAAQAQVAKQPEGASFPSLEPLETLTASADEALKALRELAVIIQRFDYGQSAYGWVLFNGLVLLNANSVLRLQAWRERYADRLNAWLEAIATMDALVSFAGYAYNHPEFTMPRIEDTSPEAAYFHASGLAHPFLPQAERVANDIALGSRHGSNTDRAEVHGTQDDDAPHGKLVVITGANMAGKSTFLRACGISAVQAMVGLPVCAERLRCSVLRVQTSMRTNDSLQQHESYFYAELKRLRAIVTSLQPASQSSASKHEPPSFVLLDEILRGTNSADKKTGSVRLLTRCAALPCLTMVATHDTELGRLEQELAGLVRNYCFEGIVVPAAASAFALSGNHAAPQDSPDSPDSPHAALHNTLGERLHFDYTLRRGVANNKNATFLMEAMGII